MSDRHCACGHHFRPLSAFRLIDPGLVENFVVVRRTRYARDCMACEEGKRVRAAGAPAPKKQSADRRAPQRLPGVDIDRIHYKLGAVRKTA